MMPVHVGGRLADSGAKLHTPTTQDTLDHTLYGGAPPHATVLAHQGDQNLRRGKHHTYSDERQQTHTHGPHTRKYEPKQGG